MRILKAAMVVSCIAALSMGPARLAAQSAAAQDLQSPNAKRRARAAKQLAKKGTPDDVPALAAAVKDPDSKVREEVVKALAAIHAPGSLDPLIVATKDVDFKIRNLAIESLVNYYLAPSDAGGFLGFWKNTWSKAKGHFVRDDVKIDPAIRVEPEVVTALVEALNNTDAIEPARRAARGLGVLRAKAAVPDLVKAAHEMDEERAIESLNSLSKIQDLSAGPQLVDLLDSPSEEIRLATAVVVGLLRTEEAIPKLQSMYENGANKPTQAKSLEGLAYIGSPVSVPIFLKALWSNDKTIRAQAAEGLGRADDQKALPDLERAVNAERSAEARFAMMFAITALGRMDYLSDLVNGLSSTFRGNVVRSYVIELARKPGMLARLYPFLNSRDADVRLKLCTVLMYTGDASSIEHLERLSQDPKNDVAMEALRALRVVRLRAAASPAPN